MADLDKKLQKAQVDLVQSVLEAQEKKNLERVDMLITTAIKQLKMSRFKPDQSTCFGLIYLCRICPKIFHQSNTIKETLKSLIRRDNPPANIKGTNLKGDIVLPILSANILLASSDSPDIRSMVLHKIEQWLNVSNQKPADMVQHLLVTLCMKCQGDQQTISTLIDLRQYWLNQLNDNHVTSSKIPSDLCMSIRKLMQTETDCDSLVDYLKFLLKHDDDTVNLSRELSQFIMRRPLSLASMLNQQDVDNKLAKIILKIFTKLMIYLKGNSNDIPSIVKQDNIKNEKLSMNPIDTLKPEPKSDVTNKIDQVDMTIDSSLTVEKFKFDPNNKIENESSEASGQQFHYLYVKLPNHPKVIPLNKIVVDAILITLISLEPFKDKVSQDYDDLFSNWFIPGKINQSPTIYVDFALRNVYNLSDSIRQQLIHSSNELIIDFAMDNSQIGQLVALLHQFALNAYTVDKIIKRLYLVTDFGSFGSEIKDRTFFNELMTFYVSLGVTNAKEFRDKANKIPA